MAARLQRREDSSALTLQPGTPQAHKAVTMQTELPAFQPGKQLFTQPPSAVGVDKGSSRNFLGCQVAIFLGIDAHPDWLPLLPNGGGGRLITKLAFEVIMPAHL